MYYFDDATVCNNEKLESGSTHAYVTSCRMFLSKTLFKDEGPWPTTIFSPSNLDDRDEALNAAVTVSANQYSGGVNCVVCAVNGNISYRTHGRGVHGSKPKRSNQMSGMPLARVSVVCSGMYHVRADRRKYGGGGGRYRVLRSTCSERADTG